MIGIKTSTCYLFAFRFLLSLLEDLFRDVVEESIEIRRNDGRKLENPLGDERKQNWERNNLQRTAKICTRTQKIKNVCLVVFLQKKMSLGRGRERRKKRSNGVVITSCLAR